MSLEYLNERWNGLNEGWDDVQEEFQNIKADMNVSFVLATKDPEGNASPGYTYTVDAGASNGGGQPSCYNAIHWDPRRYTNTGSSSKSQAAR